MPDFQIILNILFQNLMLQHQSKNKLIIIMIMMMTTLEQCEADVKINRIQSQI